MLGPGFSSALRAGTAARGWRHGARVQQQQQQPRHSGICSSAAAAAGGALGPAVLGSTQAGTVFRLGTAMLGGAVIGVALGANNSKASVSQAESIHPPVSSMPFVQELGARESVEEVLSAGQMIRKHPVGQLLLHQDHLFEGMRQSGQIGEFKCFYDKSTTEFHSIVQLGKDVCGFPQTVHGGLTAAIMDETLGGLGVCLWRQGAMGLRSPAYTARLELDYKKKVPAGTVVHCIAQLDQIQDRKIWMTGQMTDGAGTVYASAKALFVAPKVQHVLFGWLPGRQKK